MISNKLNQVLISPICTSDSVILMYSQILPLEYTSHPLQISPRPNQIQVLWLVHNLLTGENGALSVRWIDFAMKKCDISLECGLHGLGMDSCNYVACLQSQSEEY